MSLLHKLIISKFQPNHKEFGIWVQPVQNGYIAKAYDYKSQKWEEQDQAGATSDVVEYLKIRNTGDDGLNPVLATLIYGFAIFFIVQEQKDLAPSLLYPAMFANISNIAGDYIYACVANITHPVVPLDDPGYTTILEALAGKEFTAENLFNALCEVQGYSYKWDDFVEKLTYEEFKEAVENIKIETE